LRDPVSENQEINQKSKRLKIKRHERRRGTIWEEERDQLERGQRIGEGNRGNMVKVYCIHV
jgi:hypothetical protein